MDIREYEHAKQLLAHVSPNHALYKPTKDMLEKVKPGPARQPSVLDKMISYAKSPLIYLSLKSYFPRLVVTVAVLYGIASLGASVYFFSGVVTPDSHHLSGLLQGDDTDLVGAMSALISAILAASATYDYQKKRVRQAYKYFEQSLLVTVFVGQVVLFFKSEGVALAWLAITLLLLVNLELLSAEHHHKT